MLKRVGKYHYTNHKKKIIFSIVLWLIYHYNKKGKLEHLKNFIMRKIKKIIMWQLKKRQVKIKESKEKENFYKELLQKYSKKARGEYLEQLSELLDKNFDLKEFKERMKDKESR